MIKLLFFLFLSFNLVAKTFSVASYNVENLFDLHHNKTEYKEYIPYKHNWNEKTLNIKLNNIARVITDMNADIVALQEIESQEALNLLLQKLPLYPYFDFVKNPNSSVGVAVISKFNIIDKATIQIRSNEKIERPIQKVTLQIDAHKHITIFNNHWRSKQASESKRIEYALSLQNYLETQNEKSDYILLGDFNSNYDEYLTFKHDKKLNDSYNITGINQVLNTTFEQQYITKETIFNSTQRVHYNLWLELPYHQRYSYFYKNNPNTPDNIILSKALFDHHNVSYVNGSFKAFMPSYLVTQKKIHRWKMKNNEHIGEGYSDHLPILASFSTNPYVLPNPTVQRNTIASLYELDTLSQPLAIKELMVLYKEGNNAILKGKNDRAIYAYNCANELQEGYAYDIEIQQIHSHFGLQEITQLHILKKYPQKQNPTQYFLEAKQTNLFDLQFQNEIIHHLTGVYEKGYLYINKSKKEKIKLYAKNKSLLPKNGQKITIMSGHLGIFKSDVQIIIYKKSDFRVN